MRWWLAAFQQEDKPAQNDVQGYWWVGYGGYPGWYAAPVYYGTPWADLAKTSYTYTCRIDGKRPMLQGDWEYYRSVIEPLFQEPGIEYVGEVNDEQKADVSVQSPSVWEHSGELARASAKPAGVLWRGC